jgi:hypothetical protein
MSVRVMAAIFEHSQLRPVPRLVMLALADHADHDGFAWPGIDRLAQKTGLSRSGVQRALGEAETAGELTRTVGGGRSSTSLYRITLVDNHAGVGDKGPHTAAVSGPERAADRTERAADRAIKGRTLRPESSINHQEPRAAGDFGNPHPPPPAPDPAEIRAHVGAIRAALKRGGITAGALRAAAPSTEPADAPALFAIEGDAGADGEGEGLA